MESKAKPAVRGGSSGFGPAPPMWLARRVNSMNWELGMLGIFVFYVVIVFFELALDDSEVRLPPQPERRRPARCI